MSLVSVLFSMAALAAILNAVLQAWAHNLNAAVWASVTAALWVVGIYLRGRIDEQRA